MFPDHSKRDKAENIIQSAKNRSLTRTNLIQKRPAACRKKQPNEWKKKNKKQKKKNNKQTNNSALSTLNLTNWQLSLMFFFSKSENKTRVALYPGVSFTDSSRANPARPTGKGDIKNVKHSLKNQYKQNRFVKNLSDTPPTDHNKTLFSNLLEIRSHVNLIRSASISPQASYDTRSSQRNL